MFVVPVWVPGMQCSRDSVWGVEIFQVWVESSGEFLLLGYGTNARSRLPLKKIYIPPSTGRRVTWFMAKLFEVYDMCE